MKRIVIIGATSCIAEHCARLWLKEPAELVLVGRNQTKLDVIAQDLKVRSPESSITNLVTDFGDPQKIKALAESLGEIPIDIVLVAHGSLPDQQSCQQDLTLCKETLDINAISPVLFAEAFANQMARVNHGTLAVIGSVAGDRGRKSNYVYGAAKGLLTRYIQGMQHRLANTDIAIILVKPGPTETPMTDHLRAEGLKMAAPQVVARCIVQGIGNSTPVIYAPGKWRLIMFFVRHLPRIVFNRLDI